MAGLHLAFRNKVVQTLGPGIKIYKDNNIPSVFFYFIDLKLFAVSVPDRLDVTGFRT